MMRTVQKCHSLCASKTLQNPSLPGSQEIILQLVILTLINSGLICFVLDFFPPFFLKGRLLDGNNEKGKSHIHSIFRKVKSLRICLYPSLCLHFWYWYGSPKAEQKSQLSCSRRALHQPQFVCVTWLYSRFSLKLPLVLNIPALPLYVTNSKCQKPLVSTLKNSIPEILDYHDRVKKNVDLTIYYQKLHNGYSEVGVIYLPPILQPHWLSALRLFLILFIDLRV